jgi:hypothetical protein
MKKLTLFVSILCFFQFGNTLVAQTSKAASAEKVTLNQGAAVPNATEPKKSKGKSKTDKAVTPSKERLQNVETIKTTTTTTTVTETPPVNNGRVDIQTNTAQKPEATPADYAEIDKYTQPIIQERTNGNINWTQQFVEAKGQAVIDTERFTNVAQARAMATRGAVVVAQRNLLEIVKGVNVVGETTVQDMATTSDYIYTRVEGLVKGAEQVGQAREMNGMMEVTLRMPIYGKVGVASAIENNDIAMAQKKMGLAPMSAMNAAENFSAGDEVVDGSKPVVFTFKGKQIDPSMFPVIVDDKGNVKLDFSTLYDTKTGKFPQYVQLGKEVMQDLGLKKGVDIIELVQNAQGQFTIPQASKKKAVWQKIGNVAQKIGKVLFSFI